MRARVALVVIVCLAGGCLRRNASRSLVDTRWGQIQGLMAGITVMYAVQTIAAATGDLPWKDKYHVSIGGGVQAWVGPAMASTALQERPAVAGGRTDCPTGVLRLPPSVKADWADIIQRQTASAKAGRVAALDLRQSPYRRGLAQSPG